MDTLMGRYRNVSILAAAVFIQLIGLAVQVKRPTENESTRLIRVWTVTAVTPLEKGLVHVQNKVTDVWHNYIYLRGVRQQNRALQEQIQQLQLDQVRLTQDAQQAHRLQALLGFKEQYIDKTTAAQVIGSSGSEQSRTVYLDKGSDDGIKVDMPVISSQGVVGKVIKVFSRTSLVLLINDQNSGVGIIVDRSRLQAVLKGKTGGKLGLENVMAEEDVKPGDRLLTSGGDQIFPKGLPVGTVSDVRQGSEFLQVNVQPAAALNRLEEVLVITKKQERTPELANENSVRAADILSQRLPSVPDKPPQTTAGPATAPARTAGPPGVQSAPQQKPALGVTHSTGAPSTASPNPNAQRPTTAAGSPGSTQTKPATLTSAPKTNPPVTNPAGGTPANSNTAAKPGASPTAKPNTEPVQPPTDQQPGDTPQ
ncbi:MAG TPA: rod shape-determining protein MreC [Terriglobales bacterium]|nr:rod shape-determining protein MreC [Terriglobales bacterium]